MEAAMPMHTVCTGGRINYRGPWEDGGEMSEMEGDTSILPA